MRINVSLRPLRKTKDILAENHNFFLNFTNVTSTFMTFTHVQKYFGTRQMFLTHDKIYRCQQIHHLSDKKTKVRQLIQQKYD